MRLRFFIICASTLLLPSGAFAQSLGGLADTSSFTVSVNPQYPAPYSTASLSFLSSTLNLSDATVSVSVGGKNIYQGSVQPVAVPLGQVGSVTNVSVTLSSNGTDYNQTLVIQPEDVALVAEPISSSPPLYLGKPLVPLDGDVRVVAMANMKNGSGAALNPSSLSYAWTVDDTQIANSSGIGKESIMVASPLQYRSRTVSVVVTSQDGSLVGGDSLSLMSLDPTVHIYEDDPLLGILFDHALSDNFAVANTESTLYAAPFSFATTDGAPLLEWFLNGSPAQSGNTITLRPSGSGEGTASLSLTASAGADTATTNLSLSFGTTPNLNLFGL